MDKRKYLCFVCGKILVNPNEFKCHIVESHEEGREYILCPLVRCQMPVRCLRTHFKVMHKFDKIPKIKQMRALILYDTKNPQKKRKKIPTFKEGYHVSPKNNGKQMHFRSSYERNAYLCLDEIKEVISYEVEPFGINYYFKGKQKTYFPDLKVNFSDGKVEIWEVKPVNQVILEQNMAKFNFAKQFCLLRGWTFKVITEKELQELKIIAEGFNNKT